MTHHCLLKFFTDLLYFSLHVLLQRMWILKRGFQHHRIDLFIYSLNNQQTCGLFYHSCCIARLSRDLLKSFCCLSCHFYYYFPNSLTLCGHTCHTFYIIPLKNLPLLLFHLFYPTFNARTFSSGSDFSYVFLPFNSVFQNQRISFFKSLNYIFPILMLQDTLPGLYYSSKTSKTFDLNLSSSYSYFALIFLNLRFKLYN